MAFIPSQSQLAFAGMGIYEDKDLDGFSPFQGDCNDNDPNVYPGNGCDPAAYVEYTIDLVEGMIDDGEFDINGGQTTALLAILTNAINSFESENNNAAIGQLNAFINQIEKYIQQGKISSEDGQELIQTVELLLESL